MKVTAGAKPEPQKLPYEAPAVVASEVSRPLGADVKVDPTAFISVVGLVRHEGQYAVVSGKVQFCKIETVTIGEPTNVAIARSHLLITAEDVLASVHNGPA